MIVGACIRFLLLLVFLLGIIKVSVFHVFVLRSFVLSQCLADLLKQRIAVLACRIKMVRNADKIAVFE